jgi:hypothetical protein
MARPADAAGEAEGIRYAEVRVGASGAAVIVAIAAESQGAALQADRTSDRG